MEEVTSFDTVERREILGMKTLLQESNLNQWFLNESVRVYARKVNHDGHLHILEERYHRLNNLRWQSKYNTSNGTVLKHRLMLLFGSFSLSSIYCWDSELLTQKNLKCLILMKKEEGGGEVVIIAATHPTPPVSYSRGTQGQGMPFLAHKGKKETHPYLNILINKCLAIRPRGTKIK